MPAAAAAAPAPAATATRAATTRSAPEVEANVGHEDVYDALHVQPQVRPP
jgi:hypothetical protein